jgi:hypothetical protein
MANEASAPPTAVDNLRKRLTQGRGRLVVIAATTLAWLMDLLVVRRLEAHHVITHSYNVTLIQLEKLSTIAFVVITLGLCISLYRRCNSQLFRWALAYLTFSVIQVIANVLAMVGSAGHSRGGGLSSLWDVAAVYMESVIVFTFVYIFLDVSTPGGAFVWPSRDGAAPDTPQIIDYLFISLNVNSTYGPTSEALVSRAAKLVMALQVILAILMLTVLIARSVSAIS